MALFVAAGTGVAATEDTPPVEPPGSTPSPSFSAPKLPVPDAPGYFILVDDALWHDEALRALVTWRTRRGFNVDVRPVSVVGRDPSSIKDELEDRYAQGTTHVLFIGDDPAIPVFQGSLYPSENWYTTVDGNDVFPDLALGRIPLTDAEDLAIYVERLLRYERGVEFGSYPERVVMVAHRTGHPGKYSRNNREIAQVDYARPVEFERIEGGDGALNADVISALIEGAGILHYRGYGAPDSWQFWDAEAQDFSGNEIAGTTVPPVVFSVACDNGWIDGAGRSLSEEWLDEGALGVLASMRRSYSGPNDLMAMELYRLLLDEGVTTAGPLLNRLRDYLLGIGGAYPCHNAQTYLWLGDPDFGIRTRAPKGLEISAPRGVAADENQVDVLCAVAGAARSDVVVTLTRGRRLLARATSDELGHARLLLPLAEPSGPAVLTATGTDLLPVEIPVELGIDAGRGRRWFGNAVHWRHGID